MRFPKVLAWFLCLLVIPFTAGCASSKKSKKKDYPITVARFLVEAQPRDYGVDVRLPISESVIRVQPKSVFTEYDVQGCTVVQGEFGPSLYFQLTPQSVSDLYRLSALNQGRRLVTVINGNPVGAMRIERPLSQGIIITYVEVPESELAALAANIVRTSADGREELKKSQ